MSSPELFTCRFHIVYEDIKEYKNQLAKPRDDHCVVLLYILFVLHYLLILIIIVSCYVQNDYLDLSTIFFHSLVWYNHKMLSLADKMCKSC